jgi:hypothetical protein
MVSTSKPGLPTAIQAAGAVLHSLLASWFSGVVGRQFFSAFARTREPRLCGNFCA